MRGRGVNVVLLALFCFVGPLLYRTNQVGVNLNLKDLAPSGIMMRIVDTFLAIPWLVLLLIMVNVWP